MKSRIIMITRIRSPQVKIQVASRSIGSAKICAPSSERAAAAPSVTATACRHRPVSTPQARRTAR